MDRQLERIIAGTTGFPVPDPYANASMAELLNRQVRERVDVARPTLPPRYVVRLYNDQSTAPAFVVQILMAVFGLRQQVGFRLMKTSHENGSCVVCTYSLDMAQTKVAQAMAIVASQGKNRLVPDSPCTLKFTAEPETL